MPLEKMLPSVRTGCRALVRRERHRRYEMTVQELVIESERAWLCAGCARAAAVPSGIRT